jgi:hypothetical protein
MEEKIDDVKVEYTLKEMFTNINDEFKEINRKFDDVNKKFDKIEENTSKIPVIKSKLINIDEKVDRIEVDVKNIRDNHLFHMNEDIAKLQEGSKWNEKLIKVVISGFINGIKLLPFRVVDNKIWK